MAENRRKKWFNRFRFLKSHRLWWLIACIPAVIVASACMVYVLRAMQYDISDVTAPLVNTEIFDAQNQPLGILHDNNRINITYNQIPKHLLHAFIAREDEDFFSHGGIVYSSLLRSLIQNITSLSYKQGGSTITMQLARNTYEIGSRTLDRKLLEIALTRRIERAYSKEEIFTSYLNRIYFGKDCFGIEQAARRYFNKSTAGLTLEEAATLAGIVRGPSIFNPETSPTDAKKERDAVLARMLECQYIDESTYNVTTQLPITANNHARSTLTSYPILWCENELPANLGIEELAPSGILITTHFHIEAQRKLEEVAEYRIREFEVQLPDTDSPLPKRDVNELTGCMQVAAICVESSTGHIVAVIGGRLAAEKINRWERKITPGKFFMPIVYAAGASHGKTVVPNSPSTTVAELGTHAVKQTARDLGIMSPMPDSDLLPNGLFHINLYQFAQALFFVQNQGYNRPWHAVNQVTTSLGNTIYSGKLLPLDEAKELIPREAARVIAPLPPFQYNPKDSKTKLWGILPDNTGFISMEHTRKWTVFVWIGWDSPPENYDSIKIHVIEEYKGKKVEGKAEVEVTKQRMVQKPINEFLGAVATGISSDMMLFLKGMGKPAASPAKSPAESP